MSLASLSPTADADADSDEELPRLERGAGSPGWCLSSDRQAWKSRTKLAREDLYIGLNACRTRNLMWSYDVDYVSWFSVCTAPAAYFSC